MAGAYAYTPEIWPPLAAALFLCTLALYTWQRRSVPAALPLFVGMVIVVPLLLGIALEAAAVAPATKIAWFRFQSVWRMPAAIAGLCIVLEFAYPGRWVTRRNLSLLSLPALLDALAVLLKDSQWMWRRMEIGPDGSVAADLAPAGVLLTAYSLGLMLLNGAALLWLFVRSPQHRWPVALILLAQIAARVLYLGEVAHLPWPDPVDLVVLALLLPSTTYAIALFGFRIFDPLPAVRRAVIEQVHAGVVAFDPHWRVLSLNPTAESILGVRAGAARGRTWQQLASPARRLPTLPAESPGGAEAATQTAEMTFGSGPDARTYAPALSSLHDFRGLLIGHLLMLHDVTEEHRAQAQVLEQQRSLAMLRERELLARELHDGIGQVLGFASLKLAATRKLIADGRLDTADNQLAHLESVMVDAHADVREHILNLRTAPTAEKPFFAALQQYVDGCRQNYGMQVGVSIGGGLDDSALSPEAQVQLFRILQEAFSNARKHAQTDCVRISFDLEGDLLRMRVVDDGQGFDARQRSGTGQNHFGLRFMRERAEQLHGSLQVVSAPGQGTCVEVTVPVRARSPALPGPGSPAAGAREREDDERCAS